MWNIAGVGLREAEYPVIKKQTFAAQSMSRKSLVISGKCGSPDRIDAHCRT